MKRSIVVALLMPALLLTFPTSTSTAQPQGTKVQTYKSGLAFPVDMAWIPGTRKIFFTEKNTGRVRVMVGRTLLGTPCVDLDVDSAGEKGALGIVLHPRFKDNKFLYVYYTNSSPNENRVTRFTVRRNRCRNPKHVVRGLSAGADYHNGGQLEFVNGKLFVSTGEIHQASLAQDTNSRLGKILRLRPNGGIPAGNPFNNAVWSYGHRNPFGLAREPGTNRLFQTENGPNCDDEVNRIVKGRNYGWGTGYRCGTAGVGDRPKPPLKRYSSIIVPTDPWWYTGKLKLFRGLLMGDFNGRIHRFIMNDRRTRIRADRIVFDGSGDIVDVSTGPGRWVYFINGPQGSIMRIVRS
ncbi:MAG: PQQ-dependent sugar dehydrogenase [Actinomycetota bacterium]|nr:PQQ-dependent sugar dehydrogenase [Actinomycetota bacterium]